MKKKIKLSLISLFLFIASMVTVSAKTITIQNGQSYADLSDYSSCRKQSLDDTDTGLDNLSLDTSANGTPIVFVKKVPEGIISPSINLYCANKSTNKDESVTVKVTKTASVYEGYTDGEDDLTITLRTRKTLTQYKYCEINTNSDNNNPEYIKIENSSNGPIVSVAKVPSSGKMQTFITCTTNDGRQKNVTILVTKNSTIPSANYGIGGENDSSDSNNDADNISKDCISILGDVKDDGNANDIDGNGLPSVAYVLQKVFSFMKFLGPILVIVLTIVDLVKAVTSGDKDALSKMLKTASKRLIYAVLLFIFPTILDEFMNWFVVKGGTCGIK